MSDSSNLYSSEWEDGNIIALEHLETMPAISCFFFFLIHLTFIPLRTQTKKNGWTRI